MLRGILDQTRRMMDNQQKPQEETGGTKDPAFDDYFNQSKNISFGDLEEQSAIDEHSSSLNSTPRHIVDTEICGSGG